MNIFTQFYYFLLDLFKSRKIILELTKRDFKSKYLGSYLGLLWAFVNPAITILIFWFVFQAGFKSMPVDNYPFILWLMTGMIPWFFFSDSIANASNSIVENSFLVKKMVFRISILPVVKILSALFVHIFFIVVLFLMFWFYGYSPDIYNVQAFYYLFSAIIFILASSWITSSVILFMKDMGHIIAVLLQFGFWLTPIFWSLKIMPEKYHPIIKLNPVYYIVEGYRDSFIYKAWFWEHMNLTIYFWTVTSFTFVLGAIIFRKLRPHFGDVL
ncbi:MAG: ABC transporter permease [Deltaproteobacteria bacterium]|nr:ABC transporter permease [Deltaproteobacteria bacterium]